MSHEYRWWIDKTRKPIIVNKASIAQVMGVSVNSVDAWIRKGAPVVERGSNGVAYKIDVTQFIEWVRAYWRGITIAELRRQDMEFNRWLHEKYP
jgi:phage terminase Nu1 subunit (DNA packaging protein)